MSFTQTPNYGLYKPTINSDNDAWGGHLNNNADTLDSTLATFATPASVAAAVAPYANDVGRNLIHNPMMNVAQRGVGPFTAAGYTLDRWRLVLATDTDSVVAAGIVDAQRAQIGDEAAINALSNTFTGNAAAGAFSLIQQLVEGVRRLSGKTITVSFWAASGSGSPKLGVSVDQSFGTGGSPSSSVNLNGQSVTLSTTFTRYSVTFTLPSASGKTLGTNGDDSTAIDFWYSAGSTFNVRSGSVGVQSGIIVLWGVQLEVGSVATPLEKIDPRMDVANCIRFLQTGLAYIEGYQNAGGALGYQMSFYGPMRAIPTVGLSNFYYVNASGATATSNTTYTSFALRTIVTATGPAVTTANWTASAEL